jgi:cytidylate kinase
MNRYSRRGSTELINLRSRMYARLRGLQGPYRRSTGLDLTDTQASVLVIDVAYWDAGEVISLKLPISKG